MKKVVTQYLESLFKERKKGVIPHDDFLSRITIVAAAKVLSVSSRTLMRRLDERGTNFSDLLRELRIVLALDYLQDISLPIETIADLLGFRDRSGLTVFFNREIGCSPQDYRTKNNISRAYLHKTIKAEKAIAKKAKAEIAKAEKAKAKETKTVNVSPYRLEISPEELKADIEQYFQQLVDKRSANSITQDELIFSLQIKSFSTYYGCSIRTINRRLNEINSLFSQILEDFRFNYAHDYLLNTNLTATQISQLLGYRDKSAFFNFVKRRTGLPPSQYRQQILAPINFACPIKPEMHPH